MKVVVVPYDATWPARYVAEAAAIGRALGEALVATHHIGSTAIPGIFAKPIIDILAEVSDLGALDDREEAITRLGYEAMGELGIPGRRYFRKSDGTGTRTHQIHAFEAGSEQVTRHVTFRDYLRVHAERAALYSDLKRALAAAHPDDIESYMDGKDAFIRETDRMAAEWRAAPDR